MQLEVELVRYSIGVPTQEYEARVVNISPHAGAWERAAVNEKRALRPVLSFQRQCKYFPSLTGDVFTIFIEIHNL
jgi:hypothetical protein